MQNVFVCMSSQGLSETRVSFIIVSSAYFMSLTVHSLLLLPWFSTAVFVHLFFLTFQQHYHFLCLFNDHLAKNETSLAAFVLFLLSKPLTLKLDYELSCHHCVFCFLFPNILTACTLLNLVNSMSVLSWFLCLRLKVLILVKILGLSQLSKKISSWLHSL